MRHDKIYDETLSFKTYKIRIGVTLALYAICLLCAIMGTVIVLLNKVNAPPKTVDIVYESEIIFCDFKVMDKIRIEDEFGNVSFYVYLNGPSGNFKLTLYDKECDIAPGDKYSGYEHKTIAKLDGEVVNAGVRQVCSLTELYTTNDILEKEMVFRNKVYDEQLKKAIRNHSINYIISLSVICALLIAVLVIVETGIFKHKCKQYLRKEVKKKELLKNGGADMF